MSYSRRELYALGEPLGDSATYRKADGGLVLGDGGGGGGGGQTELAEKTITNVMELPSWARGPAQRTLAKAEALTDINSNPYQEFGGERTAGFNALQGQSFAQAGPGGFQRTVGAYMSPYQQNVTNIEKREAARQSGIQGVQQAGQATQAGAFGGGRDAIMRAERERNLMQQMGDIQAKGGQAAYDRATAQYNTGLGQLSTLGSQIQANEQRGLDVGYQNFLDRQNYPYKQLTFMSDLIRGTPVGMQSTNQVYQAPSNQLGQLAGLGLQAYGISKMAGAAEGGLMESYADGGEVQGYAGDEGSVVRSPMHDEQEMDNSVAIQTDEQLLRIIQRPSTKEELEEAKEEMAFRASRRRGLASGLDEKTSLRLAEGGGIVAFSGADESYVQDSMGAPSYSTEGSDFRNILKQDVREGEKYSPGLRGMLFGYNTLPKVATERPDLADTYKQQLSDGKTALGKGPSKDTTKVALNGPRKSPTGNPGATMANTMGGEKPTSLEDDAMNMYDKLQARQAGDLKGLQDLIAKQSGEGEKIKQQGIARMLMELGGGIARSASQRGNPENRGLSGVLMNVAEAAPLASKSMLDTDQAVRAANANDLKMQTEMAKYKVSLAKGDMTAAMSYAQNMRQLQQQQTQLSEMIRHNKATEGLQGQQIAAARSGAKGMAPYMQAFGRAQDRALKAVGEYKKTPEGMKDRTPFDTLVNNYTKKYMRTAVPDFGPTGNIYDTEG